MSRISRSTMFMEIAHVVAKRATCMRLSVGAVLVQERSIVAIGYNGVPAGHEHCLGNDCPGKFKCELTVHAELNALAHLPEGLKDDPIDLYVTDSPCAQCYRKIMEDGRIDRIFFGVPYRITTHLDTDPDEEFRRTGSTWKAPKVYRITPSGYIMNWRTKELVEVET